ncbi:MAG: hypothetical protein LC131_05810, partial [Anaerolineae bacterium]|nr:hypothetical protein [Anaerolineae bacterium]
SRTGTGNVPTASPENSTGCSKGKYHVGQKINLTAAPAWMWHVDSWNGTDNNSSTSNNNTATMPASNHTVTVNYKATPPTCYTLLRSYTGEGKAPTASPTKSAGCPVGQYVAGELITLTAEPAAGWRVMEWMGTNNNSSTATTNTLFMLQRNSTVIVVYTPICYELTLGHLGQGGNPVASPSKSEKCSDPGQYIAGESINLFASPAPGWYVESWLGTDDDESSTTQNSVVMPANNRVVTVIYAAVPPTCYTLALSFTGQGGPPTAEPANSPGCDTGQYTAGQVIALTAWPDDGWRVKAWSGTDDNSSVALTNSVTMPAADRTASVVYEIAPVVYSVFTPIVLR